MQTKSSTAASPIPSTPPPKTALGAASRRLSRRQRSLQRWNRVALAILGVILLYMVGCLVLVQAPVDQPELPGMLAGFGVVPLLGLVVAYLVTRAEVTRH